MGYSSCYPALPNGSPPLLQECQQQPSGECPSAEEITSPPKDTPLSQSRSIWSYKGPWSQIRAASELPTGLVEVCTLQCNLVDLCAWSFPTPSQEEPQINFLHANSASESASQNDLENQEMF
jgi:hypothetical protein